LPGYEGSTTIDAPIDIVWSVLVDVERMPEWTPSMQSVHLLEGPALRRGSRVRIKQPRLAASTWTVDLFDPPRPATTLLVAFEGRVGRDHRESPARRSWPHHLGDFLDPAHRSRGTGRRAAARATYASLCQLGTARPQTASRAGREPMMRRVGGDERGARRGNHASPTDSAWMWATPSAG